MILIIMILLLSVRHIFLSMKLLNQFYICTPTHKKVILYYASSLTISIYQYSYASMYACFYRFIYLFLHLFSHLFLHLFFVTLFYKKIAHHSTPHHTTPHHHTPHHTTHYNMCLQFIGVLPIERSEVQNRKSKKIFNIELKN